MSIVIEPSSGKAPSLDDGLYVVTCTGVKSVTVENDMYGNNEKIEIALEIEGETDDDGNPLTLDPRVNRKWNEKSTLFAYAQAFGLNAKSNEPFEVDDLVGKKAQALIETQEEGGWPRVTKMTAIKKGGAAKPREETQPLSDALSEAAALAEWFESLKSNGYTTKEILEAAQEIIGKTPKEMTAAEREQLTKALGAPF